MGYRSQRREQAGITLAVETACGPRRSKITPLLKGLFSSHTHGSPSAPWVSRATTFCCPRGGSAAPTRPDEYRKLLRWNGCGCRDVLWWSSSIGHRRRGPRSGHSLLASRRRLRRPRRSPVAVSEAGSPSAPAQPQLGQSVWHSPSAASPPVPQ